MRSPGVYIFITRLTPVFFRQAGIASFWRLACLRNTRALLPKVHLVCSIYVA